MKNKKEKIEYYYPNCPLCGRRMMLITWKEVILKWFCNYCQKSWKKATPEFGDRKLIEE